MKKYQETFGPDDSFKELLERARSLDLSDSHAVKEFFNLSLNVLNEALAQGDGIGITGDEISEMDQAIDGRLKKFSVA